MSRPEKQTIDYFPHYVNPGKTIMILQHEFGNDGYAFWFKLLSLLCKVEKQVYDYNNPAAWRLLLAETHVSEDIANKLLQLLAEVEAIDPGLYAAKIIWCQNLVDNLEGVYRRRQNGSIPEKPVIVNRNPPPVGVNVNRNPHSKPKETIQEETIEEKKDQHLSKVLSRNPKIAEMQKSLGFPEKNDKDPVPNPAKEAMFIKKMESRGFSWEEIFACWRAKTEQRNEFVSMRWVNEDIGKNGDRLNGENGRRSQTNGAFRSIPGNEPAGAFADIKLD